MTHRVPTDPTTDATVLVIEDERHLADLYADYLDEYRVLTAYSGAEGLDRLTDDVDVVVLDRWMPVRSGSEVLAEIRDRAVDPGIALTTTADPDFEVVGLGADDYVVKPVTRDDLCDVVERLLVVAAYTDAMGRLTRKKLTRNVLQIERRGHLLYENERLAELEAEIERLQSRVDDLAGRLDLDERDLQL